MKYIILIRAISITIMAINNKRLLLACRYNDLELMELLLDWGADVNFTNSESEAPLMVACREGHSRIVARLLQEEGLDVNKKDELGRPALLAALIHGKTDCANLLSKDERLDWNKTDMLELIFNASVREGFHSYSQEIQILFLLSI